VSSYGLSDLPYPDFSRSDLRWDGQFAEGCLEVEGEESFACAEQLYWEVLQFDPSGRSEAIDELGFLLARLDEDQSLDEAWLAVLYWRRSQLAIAHVTEQVLPETEGYSREDLTAVAPGMTQDLIRANELDPDNSAIESWLFMMELNAGLLAGASQDAKLEELFEL